MRKGRLPPRISDESHADQIRRVENEVKERAASAPPDPALAAHRFRDCCEQVAVPDPTGKLWAWCPLCRQPHVVRATFGPVAWARRAGGPCLHRDAPDTVTLHDPAAWTGFPLDELVS